MDSLTLKDVTGGEFEWVASDAEGHVALLSSFGSGLVPPAILRRGEEHTEAFRRLHTLPLRGGVRLRPRVQRDDQDFLQAAAARGLFGFEADPTGAPYELIAAPEKPILFHELPPEMAVLAQEARFEALLWRVNTILPSAAIMALT